MKHSTTSKLNLPKIKYKKIKQKKKKEYYFNMDVNIYDSYIDKDKNLFYVQFPVNNEEQTLKGIHFYNMEICQILFIHISTNNLEEIRGKKLKKFACLNIEKGNLTSIYGNFDLEGIEKLTVIVYNNDTPLPLFIDNETKTLNDKLKPKEGNGGGVIIEGP